MMRAAETTLQRGHGTPRAWMEQDTEPVLSVGELSGKLALDRWKLSGLGTRRQRPVDDAPSAARSALHLSASVGRPQA